jgi:hypothetical protein
MDTDNGEGKAESRKQKAERGKGQQLNTQNTRKTGGKWHVVRGEGRGG